jgi:hypothetical protein
VSSGAILAGMRAHLKFIPFFLLPAVFNFSPKQLKVQFVALLSFLLLQAPLSLYQRFVEFAGNMESGDYVRGTATTSSALSILMLGGITAVIALYLRRRIRLPAAVILIGVLFLPTTLNETKATLVLLPLALLAPAVFLPSGTRPLRQIMPILAIGGLAFVAFVGVYDYLIQFHSTAPPISQFVGEGSYVRYLYSGAAEQGANYIGRIDSLQFAADHITRDPFRLLFGYGAGNVSTSFVSQFDGEYAAYYDRYGIGMTQITTLLWEMGICGLVAYLLLYYIVFCDARLLSKESDESAIVGQIWAAVVIIMTLALMYKSVFSMTEIGYLFWFYSGIVASRAVEVRGEIRARREQRHDTGGELAAEDKGRIENIGIGWQA